jgi:predicted nucleotide-binding protein
MAKKRDRHEPPEMGTPSVSPEVGIDLLKGQIQRAKEMLAARPINDDRYSAWENTTTDYLIKSFGAGSPNIDRVAEIGKYGFSVMNKSEDWWEKHHAESLQSQLTMLDSMAELLQTEINISARMKKQDLYTTPPVSRRVFIVHGHNEAIREATARFVEKLGLIAVILHEQPNKGRTIIEKFSDHSDVEFAIVLLTADDRGGPISSSYEQQMPRARQNVILELGFFIGRLCRTHVCALYQDGVEIPSDYNGVLFIKLDEAGAWKALVAKELKAAGLDVDMNNVF